MKLANGKTFYVDRSKLYIPVDAIDFLTPEEMSWLIDAVTAIAIPNVKPSKRRRSPKKAAVVRSRLMASGWLGENGKPFIVAGIPLS